MARVEKLELSIPPALSHLTRHEFRTELAFRVKLQETLLQEKAKAEGKTYVGRG